MIYGQRIQISSPSVNICSPLPRHAAIDRYVTPEEFAEYEKLAMAKGFLKVSATPLTRSSYHADEDFQELRKARRAQISPQLISPSFILLPA